METTIVVLGGRVDKWGVALIFLFAVTMLALFGYPIKMEGYESIVLIPAIVDISLGTSVWTLALVALTVFGVLFLLLRGIKSIIDGD